MTNEQNSLTIDDSPTFISSPDEESSNKKVFFVNNSFYNNMRKLFIFKIFLPFYISQTY